MQSSSVYLYPNKIEVYTLASSWTEERYRKVYNRNIKIYRSTNNRIDLQVRSGDHKTKNTSGTTLVFNIIGSETQELIMQKDCVADDETIGRLYVTFTEEELRDLEEGFYDYSIIQETRETIDSTDYRVTSTAPMYVDTQFDAIGVLEVAGDVRGSASASRVIDTFSRVVNYDKTVTSNLEAPFTLPRPNYKRKYYEGLHEEFYLSEIIDGLPNISTSNSLHTFQFYFDNYDGEVIIQGSINPQGATPAAGDWTDIETVDPSTDVYKNITGKWNWFRIKHTPDANNTGSVDKILYR
jgi:hypothetical protein